jgi:hypothetical protein
VARTNREARWSHSSGQVESEATTIETGTGSIVKRLWPVVAVLRDCPPEKYWYQTVSRGLHKSEEPQSKGGK